MMIESLPGSRALAVKGNKSRADKIGELFLYFLTQSRAVVVRKDVLLPRRAIFAPLRRRLLAATGTVGIILFQGSSDFHRELLLRCVRAGVFCLKLEDVSETRRKMRRTSRYENPVPGGLLFGPLVRLRRARGAAGGGGRLSSSSG